MLQKRNPIWTWPKDHFSNIIPISERLMKRWRKNKGKSTNRKLKWVNREKAKVNKVMAKRKKGHLIHHLCQAFWPSSIWTQRELQMKQATQKDLKLQRYCQKSGKILNQAKGKNTRLTLRSRKTWKPLNRQKRLLRKHLKR